MKYIEIEKIASDLVLDKMQDGWTLRMANTSWGSAEGVTFLSKGSQMCAVAIVAEMDFDLDCTKKVSVQTGVFELRDNDMSRLGFYWKESLETVFEAWLVGGCYYDREDAWFVADREHVEAALELHKMRRKDRYVKSFRYIDGEISPELLALIRKHRGFAKAAKKNLRVQRRSIDSRREYAVQLLNKEGGVAKTLCF